MLKRIFAKFRPSPAMAVALLGVALGLGSTGWAANGAAFVLGVVNSATARTFLGANYNGTALQVSNTSTGASATALALTVAAGHPPMKVNSVTKVAKLNADYIDGIDSTGLVRAMRVTFNLVAGGTSFPITVPPNVPVGLVGTSRATGNTTLGYTGVGGNTSLRRLPGQSLSWRNSAGTIQSTNAAGSTITSLGSAHDAVPV